MIKVKLGADIGAPGAGVMLVLLHWPEKVPSELTIGLRSLIPR